MAGRQGFWGALLGLPAAQARDRFSLDELRRLHGALQQEAAVGEDNRRLLIETLRALAELMIWGDQHEPTFFEYFAEHNVLQQFSRLLRGDSTQGEVAVQVQHVDARAAACMRARPPAPARTQVLQSLSILIQNIRSPTAIFYLFSNDHLNDIVGLNFDFGDDEVLGYYINLLKAISMKFDASTIQFFFQAGRCPALASSPRVRRRRTARALQEDRGADAFPFYAAAVKFLRHPDGLVRAAVRTLTLNVYAIPDPAIQGFVSAPPAGRYFGEVAAFMAVQAQARSPARCASQQHSAPQARVLQAVQDALGAEPCTSDALQAAVGELEDTFAYCDDILVAGGRTLAPRVPPLWIYTHPRR